MTRPINLDYVFFHIDRNLLFFEEIQRRFGGRCVLETLGPEAFGMLASLDAKVMARAMADAVGIEGERTYAEHR